jgi:hypothetical protein
MRRSIRYYTHNLYAQFVYLIGFGLGEVIRPIDNHMVKQQGRDGGAQSGRPQVRWVRSVAPPSHRVCVEFGRRNTLLRVSVARWPLGQK